ncbi:hypothetical protein SBADM41S_10852 [Streptomyces badius]
MGGASLSEDRKKVTLTVPGLKANRASISARRAPSPPPTVLSCGEHRKPGTPSTPCPATRPPPSTRRRRPPWPGGAGFDTEHAGYSGGGFVDNFGQEGAAVTFDVETGRAG